MNRRHFIAASIPALGALLQTNRAAIASLQEISTPDTSFRSKRALDIHDYTHEEAVYLGALFTWLEMLEDSIDALSPAMDAIVEDPDSDEAKAAIYLPLGVWTFTAMDTQKFEGPETFALVHHYAIETFANLAGAADVISKGLAVGNATAIMLGTEHINLATESVAKLNDALPFRRPRRLEFFD